MRYIPKPFSIRHRSFLLVTGTSALALWFLLSAMYVNIKIRELHRPLDNLRLALTLDFAIDAALEQLELEAEKSHLAPNRERASELAAARTLQELTARYASLALSDADRRVVETIQGLEQHLLETIDELHRVEPRSDRAELLVQEVHEVTVRIEVILAQVSANHLAQLEAAGARLGEYQRSLYLLLAAFALAAILSLLALRRFYNRHLWTPLEELRGMVVEVGRGNLEVKARVPGSVELKPLVKAFLEMAAELREMRRGLEEKVLERTAELEAAQKELLQAEKLASLGRVISGVAHELNNPLTSILGFSELILARPELAPSLRGQVQTIREECLRLKNVVANLSTFARRTPQRVARIDLREVLDQLAALRRYQLTSDNIQLHCDRPTEPVWLDGDADQLLQVFFNLVLNAEQAIKSCRAKGNIWLACGLAGEQVWGTVQDNGAGMPPDVRERVFEPFFTTREVGQGTGLGLSIVHGIVQQHRGKIAVQSIEGSGTTFRLSFPAAAAPSTELEDTAAQGETLETTTQGPPRALVIDDELGITELVEAALEKQGLMSRVLSSSTGVEEALAAADYDLVICDMKMPGLSGLDVLRLLREKRPELAERFLLMTGDVAATEKEAAELAGVAVLRKPFTLARLNEAIRAVLHRPK